jgi:ABC-type transport system involved in multi-copper enzyme maturation permease subunit
VSYLTLAFHHHECKFFCALRFAFQFFTVLIYLTAVTFLPIVERELRVAARKRSTYWLRTVAASIALVIGSACLLLFSVAGFGPWGPGGMIFRAIMWLFVCIALGAGLFFTSDALSEEKREGTLGFLFLTDLRGYDVVAGKLLATSLRGFFPLLAFFPIVALTLLMGGVAGTQFWKTSLALLNALFFSLASGLFVSAISRDSQRALAGTLLLMLLFIFGGPLADSAIADVKARGFEPVFSLSSPGYLFGIAGGWGRTPFWQSLITTQAIAWVLFTFACVLIPRTWQQKAGKTTVASKARAYAWKYGKTARRARLRNKLLPINPVLWLASRERWQLAGLWVIAILAIGVFTWLIFEIPNQGWIVLTYPINVFMLFLYLGAASQSSRFFVEARRGGLIELLLATPLSERKIVLGQWRALLRTFALPVFIVLTLQFISSGLSHVSMRRTMAAAVSSMPTSTSSSSTNTTSSTNYVVSTTVNPRAYNPFGTRLTAQEWVTTIVASVSTVATSIANLVALCWFGMWMGMTSKNANLAALKTILFVQFLPYIVVSFGSSMAISLLFMPFLWKSGASASPTFMLWYPFLSALLMSTLFLAKDVVFFLLSRKTLFTSFRTQAVRSVSPVIVAIPPPIPAPPPIAHSPAT